MVGLYLYQGASLAVTYKNQTPMQFAVLHSNFMFYNRHKVVALIAAAGADVDTLPPNYQGSGEARTLLGVCLYWGWKKVVAALVAAGASTEPRFNEPSPVVQQDDALRGTEQQQQQGGRDRSSSDTTKARHAASAPSAADTTAAGDAGRGDTGDASVTGGEARGQCAVCLDAAATIGITHKGDNVVHCCLCAGCAEELKRSRQLSKCVYCRKPVQQLMQIVHT
jgi:hypothetical protein